MHPVSILGCGYTGLRLAQRWLGRDSEVHGFAKRPESLGQIAAAGVRSHPMDLDERSVTMDFTGHLLYYTVPPQQSGVQDQRLERLLDRLQGQPRRFVYFSTTGVYGDRAGALVDEQTPTTPETPRAIRRLAAENNVREWAEARGVPWCILRIPGIYGPGRLPLERLRQREAAIDPSESTPGNRIHVDDLVTVSLAAGLCAAAEHRIYNVTDGSDDSSTAFLVRVARICNLPDPPFISRAMAKQAFSSVTWSFLNESRRVSNRRMLQELRVALAFSDLDAGIRASL